jgi:arylsulfatase A-like enzyme
MGAGSSPNILMIVTDQQRRDSIGAYGSTGCRTPHLDRLAAEGARFDNAFTPTGLCSPVRCSLLSGVYPHAHGVLTNVGLHPVRAQLAPQQDRLGQALQSAGYRLGYVGKWHVSKQEPPAFGYQDYVSLGDYMTWRKAQGLPMLDAFNDYSTQTAVRDPAPVAMSRPAFLADNAIRLLDDYASAGSPFMLRLDFHGPHFPNVVPDPYFSMYPPEDIEPWPNAADDLRGKPAVHRIKRAHWKTEDMTWEDWAPLVSAYLGEISLIDAQVGRVLERLDRLGLGDDTLVVFTTDHGDTIGAHGICNKDYTMYEEIYRVPLIARWPGVVPPGSVIDAFVHHFLDLFATFVEAASPASTTPAPGHGRSLLPLLRGSTPPDWPDSAYCQFHGSHMGLYSMRLLTTAEWAYVYHPNDIDELYDRNADPWQLDNLATRPGEHEAVLSTLKRRMVEWMASTDDHLHNEWTVEWLTGDPELAAHAPGRRTTRW